METNKVKWYNFKIMICKNIKKFTGDNKPLQFDDLLKMDGEPVWGIFGSNPENSWWCLIEVDEEGKIWLTNNIGERHAYWSNADIACDNIVLYRCKVEKRTKKYTKGVGDYR